MSRARHRLTASRQALHHARCTYKDDGGAGGGGGEVIIRPNGSGGGGGGSGTDGDSYLVSEYGVLDVEDYCDVGQQTGWHDSVILWCGSAPDSNINVLNYKMQRYRPVMRFNLGGIPAGALIKNAVLHITILGQLGASCFGGSDVVIPHTTNIYRCKRDVDARYATLCHYDSSNEWGSPGGGQWNAMNAADVDTSTKASFNQVDYRNEGFPYFETIDFTDLVQVAISCDSFDLNTLWVRDEDQTATTCQNLGEGGDNNRIMFASGQNWVDQYDPYLVVNYIHPNPGPAINCP